jgi:hypothetical protein
LVVFGFEADRCARPIFEAILASPLLALRGFETYNIPIILTDKKFETSRIVSYALNLLLPGQSIGNPKSGDLLSLALFARKWDITTIINKLIEWIQPKFSSAAPIASTLYFSPIALNLCLFQLPTEQILRTQAQGLVFGNDESEEDERPGWSGDNQFHNIEPISIPPEARRHVPDGSVLDIGSMPYPLFKTLPIPSIWALLRAQALAKLQGKQDDWPVICQEFERLMADMCRSHQVKK